MGTYTPEFYSITRRALRLFSIGTTMHRSVYLHYVTSPCKISQASLLHFYTVSDQKLDGGNKATQCLQVQVCIYTYADSYLWDRCIEP